MRHFLSISDISKEEFVYILEKSRELKRDLKGGVVSDKFKGKTLAMVFEKPSLRTRISFEVGMTQLGGHAIYLAPSDIGLGKRESIHDVSKTISKMCDMIMARVFAHQVLEELAQYSGVPVINALSDLEHPCQILADFLTIKEKKGQLEGIKLAFIGDGNNNVTHSLALASALMGVNFCVASPKDYKMNKKILDKARVLSGEIYETSNAYEAVKNADVIYTDTWVSMGSEVEKEERLLQFKDYQITTDLMKFAKPDAIFMHDLPAYRGNEVVSEVIDGAQSVVFDQAENRLHAQKGLMVFLAEKE